MSTRRPGTLFCSSGGPNRIATTTEWPERSRTFTLQKTEMGENSQFTFKKNRIKNHERGHCVQTACLRRLQKAEDWKQKGGVVIAWNQGGKECASSFGGIGGGGLVISLFQWKI